ncbi:MAG: Hsp33 family molecular chaperone HslO [Parvibaculales bacterium]
MASDTPSERSSSGTPLSGSAVENDNLALPFRVEGQNVNGRVVRLNGVVGEILAAHDYPEAVNIMLGEALVLAAMLGTMLKFDGRFILQLHGGGPINTLMADYTSGGGLRGFAQFDTDQLHEALRAGKTGIELLGDKGHMAFTVDQGADMERYQGIVPLEGATLAEAALGYFQRSEQIGTCLKLVAAPLLLSGGQCDWRAGGIVLQQVANEGGNEGGNAGGNEGGGEEAAQQTVKQAEIPPEFSAPTDPANDDDWHRLSVLLQTAQPDELLDPDLSPQNLAFRLFHEDGVRVFEARPLHFECPCSGDRVRNMLTGLPAEDQREMQREEKIEVRCEFCNALYQFSPAEIFGDTASDIDGE